MYSLLEQSNQDALPRILVLVPAGCTAPAVLSQWVSTEYELELQVLDQHNFFERERPISLVLLWADGSPMNVAKQVALVMRREFTQPLVVVLPEERRGQSNVTIEQGATEVLFRHQAASMLQPSIQRALTRFYRQWERERALLFDELTGLWNLTAFRRHLSNALVRVSMQPEYSLAVLHIGVDGFKLINSGLGQHLGDQLLRAVCERLKSTLRTSDVISRKGGDEFSLLMVGRGLDRAIQFISNRLLSELSSAPYHLGVDNEHEVFSSVCIGISVSHGEHSVNGMLQDAYIALQRAKRRGRNNALLFVPDEENNARQRLELQGALRMAVQRREFQLYYQPVIHAKTRTIAYFEALVRWRRGGGVVSPCDFLPAAEETNLIVPMGWQVMHQACRQIVDWQQKGINTKVSVNLSAEQLNTDQLFNQMLFCIEASGVAPECIKLELTESSLIENTKSTEILQLLQQMGIEVYLDDFGTGYSSLAYLERFPLNGLKIDRAFVMEITQSERRIALMEKIIELGHVLGLTVVAEGIERQEELEILTNLNCDLIQGYYFARPMPAEQAEEFILEFQRLHRRWPWQLN